jgi:hypothetical protein
MAPFNGDKDIGPGFGSCPILLSIHAFTYKDSEEALGGVVGTAAHGTHAADHLVRFEKPLIFLRGKLASPIRVQNDRDASRPLPQRHKHGLDHQLTVLIRTH